MDDKKRGRIWSKIPGGHFVLGLTLLFLLSFTILSDIHVGSDGFSYYAYLRSAVLDGDLNFYNEDGNYNINRHVMTTYWTRTETGYVPTLFSIGPAILWLPFFLVGHGWAVAAHLPPGGFSFPEVFATALGNALYGFLAIVLSYKFARAHAPPWAARIAAVAVWFGTALVSYIYKEPTFAHATSAFAVALFLYLWQSSRGHRTWLDAAVLGLAGGFMLLTRWQNLLFFLVPALESLGPLWKAWRARLHAEATSIVGKNLVLLGAALLAFTPQMLAWRLIYGRLALIPQGNAALHWLSPKILELLFAPYHGFFFFTPLAALAVLGLGVVLPRRDRLLAIALLLILALQVYVNASFDDWWAGYSFGMRRLVNCTPLLVLGLAVLLNSIKRPWLRRSVLALVAILVLWNLNLLVQVERRWKLDPADRTIGFYLDAVANIPDLLKNPRENLWFYGYSYFPTLTAGLRRLDPIVMTSALLLAGTGAGMAVALYTAQKRGYRSVRLGTLLLGTGILVADLFILSSGTQTRTVYATWLADPSYALLPTQIEEGDRYDAMRVQGDLVISPTTSWEADIQAPVQMRGIEMLSYVEGSVQEGAEIAQVVLSDPMGDQMQFLVRAGIDTDNADPDPGNALIPRQEIAVVLPEGTPDWVPYWLLPGYLGVQTRKYYLTRLNFSRPCSPNEIEIRYLQDSGNLHLGSLIYIPQNNEPIEP